MCLTLCDPIDGSPPGSPVPGILQARTLEWVAVSFSNAWKWNMKVKPLNSVRPSATPWTAAFQAPLSIGFSRQEYWNIIQYLSFVFFCLTYFTLHNAVQVHLFGCKWQNFIIFYGQIADNYSFCLSYLCAMISYFNLYFSDYCWSWTYMFIDCSIVFPILYLFNEHYLTSLCKKLDHLKI